MPTKKARKSRKATQKSEVPGVQFAIAEFDRIRTKTNLIEDDVENIKQKVTEMLKKYEVCADGYEDLANRYSILLNNYNSVRIAFRQAYETVAAPNTYTQAEVEAMSSEEYRQKILIPLGMGRKV